MIHDLWHLQIRCDGLEHDRVLYLLGGEVPRQIRDQFRFRADRGVTNAGRDHPTLVEYAQCGLQIAFIGYFKQ